MQSADKGVGYYRDDAGPSPSSADLKLIVDDANASVPVEREKSFESEAPRQDKELDMGLVKGLWINFMGTSPVWYKQAICGAMVLNVMLVLTTGSRVTRTHGDHEVTVTDCPLAAWAVLLEFIGTLAMAAYCYPLQPGATAFIGKTGALLRILSHRAALLHAGGLLTIQAYIMGLAPAERLAHEVEINIDILLLVTFMVACVHFLKNLLLAIFTNLLVKVESKVLLSIGIMLTSAVMSAVMDALSVAAVLVSVCSGVLGAPAVWAPSLAMLDRTTLPSSRAGPVQGSTTTRCRMPTCQSWRAPALR